MPIVLAASCMPCPNAMAVAETAWARRNRRLSTPGWPWRKAHKTASIIRYPSRNPTSGETTIGIATFSPKPAQQRVGRGGRQAEVPGDQVPGNGTDHPGEDDRQARAADRQGHQVLADGLGDPLTEVRAD